MIKNIFKKETSKAFNVKATFYRLGNMHLAFKAMTRELGWDSIVPSPLNQKLSEFGFKHSPESACLPFKLMLANFKETFDRGADTIIAFMPRNTLTWCRYDDYFIGIADVLRKHNYDFKTVYLSGTIKTILNEFRKVDPSLSITKIATSIAVFYRTFRAVEFVERCDMEIRPFVKNKLEVDKFTNNSLKLIDAAKSLSEINKARKYIEIQKHKLLDGVFKKDTIKLLVVGDIFSISDSHSSHDFIRKLGNMDVLVYRPVSLSDLFMLLIPFSGEMKRIKRFKQIGTNYVTEEFGGTCQIQLGAVLDNIKEYDGIVHAYVFTCMPEMVTSKILERISKDYNKPVLTLVFDEHTSDAGLITRLEAFVDLLRERKQKYRSGVGSS